LQTFAEAADCRKKYETQLLIAVLLKDNETRSPDRARCDGQDSHQQVFDGSRRVAISESR
jgi:hypothetical protein